MLILISKNGKVSYKTRARRPAMNHKVKNFRDKSLSTIHNVPIFPDLIVKFNQKLMKKVSLIITAMAIALTSTSALAQEKEIELKEVVISATKFKLEKEKVGKVIYKITQKEIQQNTGKTVIELLNNLPGI